MHDRVHSQETESRADIRSSRGLKLRSLQLGLSGVADMVEFHRTAGSTGVALPGARGIWLPFPVEYKRGKPKIDDSDKVQLCAQAMCLEEMLNTSIPAGALYYGVKHKRFEVIFDEPLRNSVTTHAVRLHELISQGITPPAVYEPKCDNCSLLELCMPHNRNDQCEKYIEGIYRQIDTEAAEAECTHPPVSPADKMESHHATSS